MLRITSILVVVSTLVFLSGCTMCQHPYDYCGPVYDDCCGYCSQQRAGSILDGTIESSEDMQSIEENQISRRSQTIAKEKSKKKTAQATVRTRKTELAGNSVQPGYVPGSEQLISVSDRVVGTTESTTASRQIDPSGWMARRPTMEIQR